MLIEKINEYIRSIHNDDVKFLEREFGCVISCNSITHFKSPSFKTEYTVNGCKYVSTESLEHKRISSANSNQSFLNAKIIKYEDVYGNPVLSFYKKIPTFDSADREYDSYQQLYFFYNKRNISALYCHGGYSLSSMTLYENIKPIGLILRLMLRITRIPAML